MPQRPNHDEIGVFGDRRREQERAFSEWELPGRGWSIFGETIDPEPRMRAPFRTPEPTRPIDDARIPSSVGRLFENRWVPEPLPIADRQTGPDALRPRLCAPVATKTFRLVVPSEIKIPFEQTEQILSNLANTATFISFEILGTSDAITFQITCPASASDAVASLLKNHLPGVVFQQGEDAVKEHIRQAIPGRIDLSLMADFGLGREWFKPLPTGSSFPTDPLLPLIASFDEITNDETICFQVLLRRTRQNWNGSANNLIFDESGKLRFAELQNIIPAIKDKLARRLFAANVRVLIETRSAQRSQQVARRLGTFFRQFSSAAGNEMIPLQNDGLPAAKHLQSFLDRTTYRTGALLSAPEISGLVHLPTDAIKSPKLRRSENRTKAAPDFATRGSLLLGENEHLGQMRKIHLGQEQRVKHTHIAGATGSGKTNLILNMVKQDIDLGCGFAVVDPHGDLIDEVIERIPEDRLKDVVLFNAADDAYPIGFNILSAHSELEKTLISSDLVAIFRRFSTSWGDQMNSVLANAILAFLESTRGGNLLDLKRFLIEKDFREEFLTTVQDDEIRYYWQKEFPELRGKPYASLLTRLDTFLRSKLIRFIVAQKENRLDIRQIMDQKKILLIRLSLGAIGEENAYLLGSLIVSKLHQATLSRQDVAEETRNPFYLYIDEAHHFLTPSMNQILSGTRKYKLGLILAHQQLNQFHTGDADILSSVLSNCYTRICFRLDDTDAERISRGFSFFKPEHLKDLGVGEAICRFEQSRNDFNLKTYPIAAVPENIAVERRIAVIEHSRRLYAKPKDEVAAELKAKHVEKPPSRTSTKKVIALAPLAATTPAPPTDIPEPPDAREKHSPATAEQQPDRVGTAIPADPISMPVPNSVANQGLQQHRYLQSLVKRMGEDKGFRVTIEKPVFGGIGKIDVALENETLRIACEISVTNEPDYEVQNIRKCLSAGYSPVILISADKRHLGKIREKAGEQLSAEEHSTIEFLTPDEFYDWLKDLDLGETGSDEKVKGFRVKVKLKSVEQTDQTTRKKAISDVVFGAMKRMKNKDDDA
ncbi:MAG: type IV secretion system DNA-binding domain-containing protein [Chloracidobacterium sp.]|nr:type IV secretion system DNA-binding domain-containing protein [Chloracidobacterium sp.]